MSKQKVEIKRDYYAIKVSEDNRAELTLYGEIVKNIPRDWYTGEPLEGLFISLEGFLDDLKAVSEVDDLTIRINSAGGDAYAAIAIHNRLKELKAKKTVIVDGVAMSGGSLIMCAGDLVKVNASSLIMIHNCWSFLFGGYNSTELRKMAESNDAVDKAQAAIYTAKSKKSEAEILEMMKAETFMTGREAFDFGFANEVIDDESLKISASADGKTLFVNGKEVSLEYSGIRIPKGFDFLKSAHAKAFDIKQNKQDINPEGGKEKMANTVSELRAEYPELTRQLEEEVKAANKQSTSSDVLAAERKRMQEIDEIAATIGDDDLVMEAKYTAPCSAQELAFKALKKHSKQGDEYVQKVMGDYKASGAEQVSATPAIHENQLFNEKKEIEKNVDAALEAVKQASGR